MKICKEVYVLHCFMKKSTAGIATPSPDIELIRTHLKRVMAQLEAGT